jgi:hypothetical protein
MKGSSLEQCVEKSEKYIKKTGVCVLVYDLKGSSNYSSEKWHHMLSRLNILRNDLNNTFKDRIPNDPFGEDPHGYGFQPMRGDSGCAPINSAEAVREIINYVSANYKDIPLWWEVAKDYWDRKGMRMLK